jgi:MtrB/PioB family decaheme-associated outer membrane protein
VPYAPGITNNNLGGLVETTSYFGMLTSKLTKELDLAASWRFEDRNDKTPARYYLDSTANAFEFPNGLTNARESHQLNRGKLELSYRLPEGYRVVGGLDYDEKKTPDAYRESVTDKTIRLELRKSMSETINGSVRIAHSDRTGGAWHLLDGTPAAGATTFSTTTGVAAPLHFADRTRDKAKFMLDWVPMEPLSVQLFYEQGKDRYSFSPPSGNAQMGMTEGKTMLYGLDIAFTISENWKAQGYYSYNENKTHQNAVYTPRINAADQNCTGVTITTTCVPWTADLNLRGSVLGIGVKGKVSTWDVGADYLWTEDTTSYNILFNPLLNGAGNSVPAGAGVLPDTKYSINRLKLFGTYAFTKKTRVRLDYIYDVRKMDDFTWANWTYSDGTRVNVDPKQTTNFAGVTLMHSF